VVAREVLAYRLANDPAESPLEERRALARSYLNAFPEPDRRHATREMTGKALLITGQQAHPEALRLPQELVKRRLATDCDAEQGGLQRQREQRNHRQPESLTVDVDGDHRDGGGDVTQKRTQVVGGHAPIIGSELDGYLARHLPLLNSSACSAFASLSSVASKVGSAGALQKRIGVTPGPITDARYTWPSPAGRL